MAVNRYLAEKIVVNWELGTPISTLKVVWGKTARRSKEPGGDLIYPDLVVARTVNVRLNLLSQSVEYVLQAPHKLRKKRAGKTSVVQADSKVAFHTITNSISLATSY